MKKIFTLLLSMACVASLHAQESVTFSINMSNVTDTFTQVYVSGTFNDWSGESSPLNNMGNGIWSGTFSLPAGTHEFKFTADNWALQEDLAGTTTCTLTTDEFTNRIFTVIGGFPNILSTFCWESCTGCSTMPVDSVDITFMVNAEYETVAAEGIFIAGGGNFGNPGDNPMTQAADGTWEITMRKPLGFASHYTFTNGACPDYSCKENLVGQACGDPNAFNDRYLPAVQSDTTLMHCFSQCTDDLSCVAPAAPVNVIFQVDMSETDTLGTMYITGGSLDGWCGTCLAMTDPDGDNIYSDTLLLEPGTYEYKFNNGGWDGTEALDPEEDADCTLTTGEFTNRIVTVGDSDMTVGPFCFNACEVCTDISVGQPTNNLFAIQPTVTSTTTVLIFNQNATNTRAVRIFNTAGQLVCNIDVARTAPQHELDVQNMPTGMYFIHVQNDEQWATQKIFVK